MLLRGTMSQQRNRRSSEELRASKINFVVEQDGTPERELKSKLVMLFNRAAWVNVAYLARVTYEDAGPMHVALCVRGQPGRGDGPVAVH